MTKPCIMAGAYNACSSGLTEGLCQLTIYIGRVGSSLQAFAVHGLFRVSSALSSIWAHMLELCWSYMPGMLPSASGQTQCWLSKCLVQNTCVCRFAHLPSLPAGRMMYILVPNRICGKQQCQLHVPLLDLSLKSPDKHMMHYSC